MSTEPPVERVGVERDEADPPAAPYQALFPNLDKFSPTSLRRGSLDRRRLVRALLVFAAALVIATAIIVVPQLLR